MSNQGQSSRCIPPNTIPSHQPCDAWRRGHCRFGRNCKFKHEPTEKGARKNTKNASWQENNGNPNCSDPTVNDSSSGAGPNRSASSKNGEIIYNISNFPVNSITCRDWKLGRCSRGERCRFSHTDEPAARPVEHEHSNAHETPSRQEAEIVTDEREKEEIAIRVAEVRARAERQAREEAERNKANRRKIDKEAQEHASLRRTELAQRTRRAEREQVQKDAQEKARRIEEAEKMREEQIAQEKAASEAQSELLRQARERIAEEERRRAAERLAQEENAREAFRKQQLEQQALRVQEAKVVEQFIVFDSSLVTCAAGLDITHTITGFDLCSVTIKNLPRDAKQEEIADIFLQQGIDRANFFISSMKPNMNKIEAVVLINAECGPAISLGLEGIPFRNESLSFSLSDNANHNTMGLSANSPFLLVNWRAPSDTIVAAYPTMEEARERARKLDASSWHGRQIRVVMNERPQGTAGLRSFIRSSIKIMNLPPTGQITTDLYQLTGTSSLKMLKSPHYNLEESFNTIKSHFRGFSGVRMDTYEVLTSGNQENGEVKVKVLFHGWEDAKNAHIFIGNIQGGINGPVFRPWVPPKPLRYTITIPRQQYEAQKKQWSELSEKRPECDARVQCKMGNRGDVVFVQVLGQDKKALGPLKVRVESIVSGERLDPEYWSQSLASNNAKAFFTHIYDEKQVFVRSDFKTRSLKVYGEAHKILEARTIIKDELERLSRSETTRMLDRKSVGFFVREGLGKLVELLGEENVNLNLASRPCTITVKGGDGAIHYLQRLLAESRTATFHGSAVTGTVTKDTCPICMEEASHPEQLVCGHTYCAGCFKHFLTSAANAKNFPLVCMGNDATCNVPIAVPFIRRFLPISIFRALVETAFICYLDQHPQELKYCTTPDCKQLYRRRTRLTELQCPSCFSTICPACDGEAHEDMTCQERRIHRNPALQERLNEELAQASGYKKCPQCKVWIEKTDGCNHMSCKCGAHICWRCMAISDHRGVFDGQNIYRHMEIFHGNIFDIPAEIEAEIADDILMDPIPALVEQRQVAPPVPFRPPVLAQPILEAYRGEFNPPPARLPAHERPFDVIQQLVQAERRRQALEEQRAEEERQRREDRRWCIVM